MRRSWESARGERDSWEDGFWVGFLAAIIGGLLGVLVFAFIR